VSKRWASALVALGLLAAWARAEQAPLVDLDPADLTPGEVRRWANAGKLGGSFESAEGSAPAVATIAGRKAVVFSRRRWLRSSFAAPHEITGDHPFTLAVWAHTAKLGGKAVVVSWASRPRDSAEFAYGRGREGAFCSYGSGDFGFARNRPPAAGAWHHITFTYRPGAFRVYVDGALNFEKRVTLRTKPGEPIYLGTAWDSPRSEACFGFRGAVAGVRIWGRALTHREVRNAGGWFEPFSPSPADGAVVEARSATLRWVHGDARTRSCRVYFGAGRGPVEACDARAALPSTERGTEAASGTLVLGRGYFWRVAPRDAAGKPLAKSPVWTFTVSAGPATAPQPRDRVTGVKRSIRELGWSPGRYAASQDLYFGTDRELGATPVARGLPAKAAGSPIPIPQLEYGRTYYWRVDQNNGKLPSARGDVWSFRVEDKPVANDVTFFAGSDGHYGIGGNDELNQQVIDMMNSLAGTPVPEDIGGGVVRTPRGVVLSGDLLDNGSRPESAPQIWKRFCADFGLAGDGRLVFPVYEGFGNHDGGPGRSVVRKGIRERNRRRRGLAMVSANGLHYAWDWDHVHLVQLNLFGGDGPADVANVNPQAHDPEGALAFLKRDLARNVGESGRPVVIFQHFGWPPDGMSGWWSPEAKERFFEVVKPYHVACMVHGHSHAATVYRWKGIQVIADGATARPEHPPGDFFVIRITATELIAGHRTPDGWGPRVRGPLPRPGGAKWR